MPRLSRAQKIGYGIGDVGGNLFFTLGGFYFLDFLVSFVGLPAALAGIALTVGHVWDAVTDPVVGYLSDRTVSSWGRRRPWMFAGGFLVIAAMVLFFAAPANTGANRSKVLAYVIVTVCLLNLAATLINIPYSAMTPELTDDYHERTNLNGYRMVFAVIGTLAAGPLVLVLIQAFGGGRNGWIGMAAVVGTIIASATWVVVAGTRKLSSSKRPQALPIGAYWHVLGQKPFLLALIPWSLHISGVSMVQAAFVLYFRYVRGDAVIFQRALLILLVSAMAWIPVWVKISERIGKKAAYNLGMVLFATAVLVFFFVGYRSPIWITYALMAFGGVGLATNYVMPYSIVPDVVSYDYAKNGVQREGAYYGIWTFMSKVGRSLALGVSGLVLGAFGFIETTGGQTVNQPESALLAIRLLTGPIPAVCFAAGIVVLHFYPLTRATYTEMLQRAQRKR